MKINFERRELEVLSHQVSIEKTSIFSRYLRAILNFNIQRTKAKVLKTLSSNVLVTYYLNNATLLLSLQEFSTQLTPVNIYHLHGKLSNVAFLVQSN